MSGEVGRGMARNSASARGGQFKRVDKRAFVSSSQAVVSVVSQAILSVQFS